MTENPYNSPAPTPAAKERPPSALKPAAAMFARHALCVATAILALLIANWLIPAYAAGVKLPKFSAPTLLVLHVARVVMKSWVFILFLIPAYFAFVVGLQLVDQKLPGIRSAWALLFWLLAILFLGFFCFGIAILFL